jgi:hypothetical protein
MFYKSILNAVAVAVAVAAVMFVGCGGDGNPAGGDDKLAGDWSIIEIRQEWGSDGGGEVVRESDRTKEFWSFKSSGDITFTAFGKFSDFWIEYIYRSAKYSVKGDSVFIYDEGENEAGLRMKYGISGNNLTLFFFFFGDSYEDDGSSASTTIKATKGDVAKFKRDLGGSLKSRDPKLNDTEWDRLSSDPDCESCGNDRINFGGGYYEYPEIYLSESYDATWYTESNNLMLVSLKCDGYETVTEDDYEWEDCVSVSVDKTVPLEYQLTNGTLRLRATGGDWDVWEKGDPYGFSQSKAKAKKSNGAISPFWAFAR